MAMDKLRKSKEEELDRAKREHDSYWADLNKQYQNECELARRVHGKVSGARSMENFVKGMEEINDEGWTLRSTPDSETPGGQYIWTHDEKVVQVRLKPGGDEFSAGKMTYAVEVTKMPGEPTKNLDQVLFKTDDTGSLLPKNSVAITKHGRKAHSTSSAGAWAQVYGDAPLGIKASTASTTMGDAHPKIMNASANEAGKNLYDARVQQLLGRPPYAEQVTLRKGGEGAIHAQTEPSGKAYLVSRSLAVPGVNKVASHNYIVTGAHHLGDRGDHVRIYSFGRNDKTGMLDRVDHKTTGFSEGTSAGDQSHWESLSKVNSRNVTIIDAKPDVVDAYANSLVADKTYRLVPISVNSANSNSAAQAIANRAAGKEVPTPDGHRISPGRNRWESISFGNRPDLTPQEKTKGPRVGSATKTQKTTVRPKTAEPSRRAVGSEVSQSKAEMTWKNRRGQTVTVQVKQSDRQHVTVTDHRGRERRVKYSKQTNARYGIAKVDGRNVRVEQPQSVSKFPKNSTKMKATNQKKKGPKLKP